MSLSLEQVGILVAILGGLLGWLDAKYTMRERFAKIEVKVDTMWDFQMRRGSVEAIAKGIVKANSPLQLVPEVYSQWFKSMESDLWALYSQSSQLSYANLLLKIERVFGDRLVREVCIPRGIQEGACLIAAAAVACKNPEIPDILCEDAHKFEQES
jgi:hypothetical protein